MYHGVIVGRKAKQAASQAVDSEQEDMEEPIVELEEYAEENEEEMGSNVVDAEPKSENPFSS